MIIRFNGLFKGAHIVDYPNRQRSYRVHIYVADHVYALTVNLPISKEDYLRIEEETQERDGTIEVSGALELKLKKTKKSPKTSTGAKVTTTPIPFPNSLDSALL